MLIKKTKQNKKDGFTLIELLVSIALFAIVVVIILGAITSITDANRKARTLMTVMNNLNFAVDSMTRSFNTGKNPVPENCSGYPGFSTTEINYKEITSVTEIEESGKTRRVTYCLYEDPDGLGKIIKIIGTNDSVLTSPDIDIDTENSSFTIASPSNDLQPKLMINLEGTAKVGGKISSTFSIQNSVSQKFLAI